MLLARLTTSRYTSRTPRFLSSALITPVLLSPLSECARVCSRHKRIVRAGSVVAVICTRLPCGLLPSVCLAVHAPPPPYRSLWQIYCFMTSWNWTLVLLKPMSRNKINSFLGSPAASAPIIRIMLGSLTTFLSTPSVDGVSKKS